MTPDESAWCMQEFLSGRRQKDIAKEVNVTPAHIGTSLMRFYETYGSSGPDFIHVMDYFERRDLYYAQALERYLAAGRPVKQPQRRPITAKSYEQQYFEARAEHAWLLRLEGLTLQKIGDRMGICRDRVRQLVWRQGRRLGRAMRHTKISIMEMEHGTVSSGPGASGEV
jgi:hypothetical protein